MEKPQDKKEEGKSKKTTFYVKPYTLPEGNWTAIMKRMCDVEYGCCCCATLRTGAVTFAWFFVVWFFLDMVGNVLFAFAYNGWITIEFIVGANDTITIVHKIDPFIYFVRAALQFGLSVALLLGVFDKTKLRFKLIRVFIQSFMVLIAVGAIHEAAKFVTFVSAGETNPVRLYVSLFVYIVLQGIYGWGTIVVKCYYIQAASSVVGT